MSSKGKTTAWSSAGVGRRMLGLTLSLMMVFGLMAPIRGTAVWAAEGETNSGIKDLGIQEDMGELEGELSLFQSVDGADLRTYATQADWYLGITKIECKSRLETVRQSTDYGGNVVTNTYINEADPGTQYVIIDLAATKTVSGGSSLAADRMTLSINGSTYDRILDDSFLTDHDYTAIPNSEILAGSKTGSVVFMVPEAAAAVLSDWKAALSGGTTELRAGDIVAVVTEVNEDELIPVPMGGYLADSQFQIEQDLLADYRAGSYGIDSPFLVRDPYGQAPLAAVAMFRTGDNVAAVRVTVKGKEQAQDIVYDVESAGAEHEIPIIGLYPRYQNTVELTALDASGKGVENSGALKSGALNTAGVSGYQQPAVKATSNAILEPGLTLLLTNNRVVVDEKADVRWFQTMANSSIWSANELTGRGTFYIQNYDYRNGTDPVVLYEMTWMGKVVAQYMYTEESGRFPGAHHDLTESLDQSEFFYCINADSVDVGIQRVDKSTGAPLEKIYVKDIINRTGSLEVRTKGNTTDWAHLNTVKPTADGNYLISLRNQHLVFKYDMEKKEVIWAFTPAFEFQKTNTPAIADKLVTLDMSVKDQNGNAPQWFYSQHHVSELPDLDHNERTEDILLFDNGADRSLTASTSPKYSRIAHYRIDLDSRKATQIYEAGQDRSSFYSAAWGSAQYLEQTGNYLGTGQSSEVTEFTSTGAVAWSISAGGNVYRAFRLDAADMAAGCRPLGSVRGKTFVRVGEETDFTKTELTYDPEKRVRGTLIENVYLHEKQLMLKGSAFITQGKQKNVFLVADDGKDQYYAPLLSGSTDTVYDNTTLKAIPLTLENLPAGRYNLGILVEEGSDSAYKATRYYVEKKGSLQTTASADDDQREVVEELIAKSKDSANTLTNPVVVVNPFGRAPLSAVAAFYTPKPCAVSVTVKSRPVSGDEIPADVSYQVEGGRTNSHVVPLVGLYANYENTVELRTSDGKRSILRVQTGELNPSYVRQAEITATAEQRKKTAEGLTFLTPAGAQTVPVAVDVNGDLRWAYVCAAAAPLETKPLRDGHFLVPSDRPSTEVFVTDAETALEIDLTGRIYAEYFLEGQPHHEVFERANGNLIFALSKRNNESIEDYMAEVDRETGKTLRTWDFRKIFGIPEYDAAYDPEKGGTDDTSPDSAAPHRATPSIQLSRGNHPYSDWFHQNSLFYEEGDPDDPSDDAIYVTARHQSWLAKVNAEKGAGENPSPDAVEWIYTDPSWLPQSSLDLKALILNPENEQTQEVLESLSVEETEDKTTGAAVEEPGAEENTDAGLNGETDAGKEPGSDEATAPNEAGGAPTDADKMGPDQADASQPEEEISGGAVETVPSPEAEAEATVTSGAISRLTERLASGLTGSLETDLQSAAATGGAMIAGSAHPYIYGPHAVERLENGDLIVYDNFLYGSKTQIKDASELFSRAVRLRVDEEKKTFAIKWEYGSERKDEAYTPFIGDVDYLGPGLQEKEEITDNHYLIDFGGITKDEDGKAADVVAAMLGGTISANIQEYKDGEIIWSAYLQGSKGKVASVYRAERVDLSQLPIISSDYEQYTAIENRGMYTNTPQAAVSAETLRSAADGVIPVTWKKLQDEGNRLIGTFTLPHILTDQASEAAQAKNVYIALDMGAEGLRIYKAGYAAAQPALGVMEGYYKFEIMKDNKAAQIRILIERKDGIWIVGSTGEMASSHMQYVTGETPVIDPSAPSERVMTSADSLLLKQYEEQSGQTDSVIAAVEKGGLEPGKKYVWSNPAHGIQTELLYSPIYAKKGGYVALVSGLGSGEIQAVSGTVQDLRPGIVADDRNAVKNGVRRSKVAADDIFYLYNQLELGTLPAGDPLRVLAMDVNGDYAFTPLDFSTLIRMYLEQK